MTLISEGKVQKYIVYAIGEILLVVVGILIALQINNWHEARKDTELAMSYLEGIKEDLHKDIELIDFVVEQSSVAISLISQIDNVYTGKLAHAPEKYPQFFNNPDKEQFNILFNRGKSFRSIDGNYNSLISDGKSGLIKNRVLFTNLQQIYDEQHVRIDSVYDSIKEREDQVTWTYAYQKRHWAFEDLEKAKDEKIFLDLANYTEMKYFYARSVLELKDKIGVALVLLDEEIKRMNDQLNN